MTRWLVVLALAACGSPHPVEKPAPRSRRISNAADGVAIRAVIVEFMAAIKAKSGERLTALVMDPRILFTSPGPSFDGLAAGGFTGFVDFVSSTPDAIEERFSNVEITQDGNVAWALFDYEFVQNGKVANYGVEAWQLHEKAGQWRIFSVVWTQNYPAK